MKVLVNFVSNDGTQKAARPVLQTVTKHYLGGRVGTTTGDVYRVKQETGSLNGEKYDMVAVA